MKYLFSLPLCFYGKAFIYSGRYIFTKIILCKGILFKSINRHHLFFRIHNPILSDARRAIFEQFRHIVSCPAARRDNFYHPVRRAMASRVTQFRRVTDICFMKKRGCRLAEIFSRAAAPDIYRLCPQAYLFIFSEASRKSPPPSHIPSGCARPAYPDGWCSPHR